MIAGGSNIYFIFENIALYVLHVHRNIEKLVFNKIEITDLLYMWKFILTSIN